jgi:hypothetical protein
MPAALFAACNANKLLTLLASLSTKWRSAAIVTVNNKFTASPRISAI